MTKPVPVGYALVDVVLPSHQAFIVRKWAEQAEQALRERDALESKKLRVLAKGQRCKVADTPRERLTGMVGRHVIITKVCPETRQVFAHVDEPVRFKVNSRGRRVIDFDPACIETVYGFDELIATT